MAQVHSFPNPFDFKQYTTQFKFPMPEESMQYFGKWLAQNPFATSQHIFENYYPVQKKCWDNYWTWANWTLSSLHETSFEASRLMMHCIQLSPEPHTLFRYLRMNWQKPYLSLSAQAISAARLFTQLSSENYNYWQGMSQGENMHSLAKADKKKH